MNSVVLAKELLLNSIREVYSQHKVLFDSPDAHSQDRWQDRMILPPFLGEMGFELRYFLAAVEPWLRNGWCIPAKRPEFYPAGTAFADPALFAEINAVMSRSDARPLGGAIAMPGPALALMWPSRIVTVEEEMRLHVDVTSITSGSSQHLLKVATTEMEIRQIFAARHMRRPRPITPWDSNLLKVFDGRPEHMAGGAISLAPTYKPDAFLNPAYPAYPHVGVQMRRLPYQPFRDSNAELMMAKAREAADHLGLPILVYGHPAGTYLPEGWINTAGQAPDDLLRYELSMLSQCRLMLAPESGWCDLMCWLQVPTLLEFLGRPHEFTHNRVFHPRLMLLDRELPIGEQIDRLFATTEHVPTCPPNEQNFDDMDWDDPWMRSVAENYLHGI